MIRSWALLNANAATGGACMGAGLALGCQPSLGLVACSDVVQRVLFSGYRNDVAASCVGAADACLVYLVPESLPNLLLEPLSEALT